MKRVQLGDQMFIRLEIPMLIVNRNIGHTQGKLNQIIR